MVLSRIGLMLVQLVTTVCLQSLLVTEELFFRFWEDIHWDRTKLILGAPIFFLRPDIYLADHSRGIGFWCTLAFVLAGFMGQFWGIKPMRGLIAASAITASGTVFWMYGSPPLPMEYKLWCFAYFHVALFILMIASYGLSMLYAKWIATRFEIGGQQV